MTLVAWLSGALSAFGALRAPDSTVATFTSVDITAIPIDTVNADRLSFALENGILLRSGVPFTGVVREAYPVGRVARVASYLNGMQHGITTSYYVTGQRRDVRSYQLNVGYGRHFGFWEDGTMKFDFFYINDSREGIQKQWYRSGKPYAYLTFRHDREDGMQQAWRESGRPYINYEVRDDVRYGLQKSALCSEVENGEVL